MFYKNIQHSDNLPNDTKHNDTQHNETQQNNILNNNKKITTLSIKTLSISALLSFSVSFMLSVFCAECHEQALYSECQYA
jgi:hypothetical protein